MTHEFIILSEFEVKMFIKLVNITKLLNFNVVKHF